MHLVNARLTGARLMHVKDLVQGKYLFPALWCFHKIEKWFFCGRHCRCSVGVPGGRQRARAERVES